MSEFIVAGLIFLCAWVNGVIFGAGGLLVYMIERMMKDKGMDDSNRTNAMRLLSHVVMHPVDFYHMFYSGIALNGDRVITRQPFWYLNKDEISEVVDSRPTDEERGKI